jgi:hypothetical protein
MAKIPGITCPGEVDIPKENGTDNIPAQKTGGKFKYRLYSFFCFQPNHHGKDKLQFD